MAGEDDLTDGAGEAGGPDPVDLVERRMLDIRLEEVPIPPLVPGQHERFEDLAAKATKSARSKRAKGNWVLSNALRSQGFPPLGKAECPRGEVDGVLRAAGEAIGRLQTNAAASDALQGDGAKRRHPGPMLGDTMELLTSRVLLAPADLGRSLRFYEHTLGLGIYREWGDGENRGVVFFLGGGGLLEVSGTGTAPVSPAVKLVLQVRDIDATRELLTRQGVAIEAEPERKPWGLLEMTARDPDGLELIFVEVPPEHPRRRG